MFHQIFNACHLPKGNAFSKLYVILLSLKVCENEWDQIAVRDLRDTSENILNSKSYKRATYQDIKINNKIIEIKRSLARYPIQRLEDPLLRSRLSDEIELS